jgi:hypothetical protein
MGSAPCLHRQYIREEDPLGDLTLSIYRVSSETPSTDQLGHWKARKLEYHLQGITGVD